MSFHLAPFNEISDHVGDPQLFINQLYRKLLEVRPYFPGDTNYIGACIDSLMERLEGIGATSDFDEEDC